MNYEEYAKFEFAKNLRYLVSKIDDLEKKFLKARNIDISQRELEYIALIALNEGKSFTELVAQESVSKSTFSNQVKALEAKEFVIYKPLGESKKSKTLVLTPKGKSIFKAFEEIRIHFFEKYVLPNFSDAELKKINTPVEKLIKAMKKNL